MEVVAMTQFFSKISKKLKIGYGSCHVTGVNGIRYISRWGLWSTPLTILFSKIHPVSSTVEAIPDTRENASVIYHSHPFSFLSVILKGTYTEEINDNGNIIFKKENGLIL